MRRLAAALFSVLVAAPVAMAQPYPDQPYEYGAGVGVNVDVDLDASIYSDVNVAPEGSEVPDVSVFYDRLAPYGTWYDDQVYGYVFAPANTNYVPYSNGHWAYTDFGWTWVSNESFGWATSHYGRWVWRNRWVWRPDTHWGPAWVQWRYDDNHVGWAPLGYDVDAYVPETQWRFIPTTYITSRDLPRYYIRTDVSRYVRDSRPIVRWNRHGDRRWVAGPDRTYLERHRVRPQRAAVQAKLIGRLDALERRQAEQRAAEAKVKYRARIAREQQVRTNLEAKRVQVERKQVEQQRARVKQQTNRVDRREDRVDAREEQVRRQREQLQNQQRGQREAAQRRQVEQQRDQKERADRQQRQRAEQQRNQQQREEQAATQKREQQQRQQVEQRKLQQQQQEQNQRRQVEERKQQQQQRQRDQRQQVQERKQQQQERQRDQRDQVKEQRQQQQKQRADERRGPDKKRAR